MVRKKIWKNILIKVLLKIFNLSKKNFFFSKHTTTYFNSYQLVSHKHNQILNKNHNNVLYTLFYINKIIFNDKLYNFIKIRFLSKKISLDRFDKFYSLLLLNKNFNLIFLDNSCYLLDSSFEIYFYLFLTKVLKTNFFLKMNRVKTKIPAKIIFFSKKTNKTNKNIFFKKVKTQFFFKKEIFFQNKNIFLKKLVLRE